MALRLLCIAITLGHCFSVATFGGIETETISAIATSSFTTDIFARSSLIEHANSVGHIALSRHLQEQQDDSENEEGGTGYLDNICMAVEASFTQEVACTCAGNIADSFSISCQYAAPICNDNPNDETAVQTCGKPQIAVSIVSGKVFSATTCVSEYQRGTVPLEDTCIFVDACPDSRSFCDCTASYGAQICNDCQICNNGHALTVDCTNVNVEAISTQCSAVDLDWDLAGGAGAIAGFAPAFDGFCSQIERALNNSISCNCADAVGGSFSLSCETTELLCVNGDDSQQQHLCGRVMSKVAVVDSQVESVTACATYQAPFGETCTTLALCKGVGSNSKSTGSSSVCACSATYNGEQCQSCSVCDDSASITMDCSNVYEHAVTTKCQAVTKESSHEFLPHYSAVLVGGQSSAGSRLRPFLGAAVAILVAANLWV